MSRPTQHDACPHCNAKRGWVRKPAELDQRFGSVLVRATRVLPHCKACGTWFVDASTLQSVELRAAGAALRAGELDGGGMRGVRQALGLTQTQFGALLSYTKENISRWETGAVACPRVTQLAVLAYVEAAATGAFTLDALAADLDGGRAVVLPQIDKGMRVVRAA